MGFFSWECNSCHHPMLSHWATNGVNAWMQEVVVFLEDGSKIEGTYDGYGKVMNFKEAEGKQLYSELKPTCYHYACWRKAGQPTDYKPSDNAEDQGYFFADEHDLEEPT